MLMFLRKKMLSQIQIAPFFYKLNEYKSTSKLHT